jgi:hypothetical protein
MVDQARRRQEARRRMYRRRRRVAAGIAAVVLLLLVAGGLLAFGGGDSDPDSKPEPRRASLPRGGRTLLPGQRVVAYYGAPQDDELGILGIGSPGWLRAGSNARQSPSPARGGRCCRHSS